MSLEGYSSNIIYKLNSDIKQNNDITMSLSSSSVIRITEAIFDIYKKSSYIM